MNFIDALTPKNTEEIRPGLFVQKTAKGYKQISPSAWNGEIIWKNFLFGPDALKHFFIFSLLMFIVWSYQHDVQEYQGFYERMIINPIPFCSNWTEINIINREVTYEDPYSLPDNYGQG